jgi:hypothetical protein
MRLSALLFAICLVALLGFGADVSSQQLPSVPQAAGQPAQGVTDTWHGYNGSRMWRRAEIRVIPLERVDSNKAELQSLRDRVARAEGESSTFWFTDPSVRKQLSQQLELMKELLKFAEQQQANPGKSPTALEVERRLNQIQGQVMCEACHSGIVARNDSGGR